MTLLVLCLFIFRFQYPFVNPVPILVRHSSKGIAYFVGKMSLLCFCPFPSVSVVGWFVSGLGRIIPQPVLKSAVSEALILEASP